MFTIEQIKAAHTKVKSGADFPQYIRDIAKLGVTSYSTYVEDGHSVFCGDNDNVAQSPPRHKLQTVADTPDARELERSLKEHQAGKSDYNTFCMEAASAGVEKWITNIENMTCSYYDKEGNVLLTEAIPG